MKDDRGPRLGTVRFRVDVYEHGRSIVSVEKNDDFKRISPPVELLDALETFATRLIGKRKSKAASG